MNTLRGIGLFFLQCLTTPFFVFLMIFCIPLGGKIVFRLAAIWCGLNVDMAAALGMRYHVTWDSPLPSGPAVILAKHASAWETFFLMKVFPRAATVVKKELLRVPVFGWGLAMCEPIAIDRSSPRLALSQVQKQGLDRLKKGHWISLYPEGTRTPAGFRGRYASSGAALAMAAGVPIIAVAHDAGFFWKKSLFDKRAGIIQVRVSAPMWPLKDESSTGFTHRVEAWIEAQIESFGHPPAPPLTSSKKLGATSTQTSERKPQ